MRFYGLVAITNAGIKLSLICVLAGSCDGWLLCPLTSYRLPAQISSHPLIDKIISSLWLRVNLSWRSKLEAANSSTFTYFFSFGFVCTFVGGICIRTCLWVCLRLCGRQRLMLGTSATVSLPYILRQDLSPILELTNWLNWLASQPPRAPVSFSFSVMRWQASIPTPEFHLGARDQSSDPGAYTRRMLADCLDSLLKWFSTQQTCK